MKKTVIITLFLSFIVFIGIASAVEVTLFGPNQYLRGKGKPVQNTDTFPGMVGEGKLIIKNGDENGKHRISSAVVSVDGQQVLGPNDFNQNVDSIELPVNLANNNTISVELRSKPGSYLTVLVTQEVEAESAAVIGPEGGVVETSEGVSVDIPAGALDIDKLITISFLDNPPNMPSENQISQCFEIGPSGTQFNIPATIRIPYDETNINEFSYENHLSVYTYDDSSNWWYELDNIDIDAENNAVYGQITHLSPFQVGLLMRLYWYSQDRIGMYEHKSEYPPILFVHGVNFVLGWWGKHDGYGETLPQLQSMFSDLPKNERLDIWSVEYYTGDKIEYIAARLKDAINRIKAKTGYNVVIIISHSMGGLVARAYVEGMASYRGLINDTPVPYGDDIAKILFAGTPHHGSDFASFYESLCPPLCIRIPGWLESFRQMMPGSVFLSDLNDKSKYTFPYEIAVHNIIGYHDYPGFIPDGDGIVTDESQDLLPEYGSEDFVSLNIAVLEEYMHVREPLWPYAEVDVAPDQIDHHEGLKQMKKFVLDKDLDGVTDSLDNCPNTYNPDQIDSDGNGIGDVCESATAVIIEETYDDLPLGSTVPGWLPIESGDTSTPFVQDTSFNSGIQGAAIANDFGAYIPLPQPLTGKVILEIWMDPKVGSDTNNFISLIFDNNVGGRSAITGKNDSDQWLYKGPNDIFFEPLDGEGHNIRIEYDTETAIYDYYFDRDSDGDFDSQDFIMLNVDFGIGSAGKSLTGIGINSGRGGGGKTSYFDDLRVSVEPIP